ncbi:MAG: hypothetical protein PUF12_10975 [Thermoflexaceae bacterium]|nr:hypothetical protein [Thermoflexaceae bacterium]
MKLDNFIRETAENFRFDVKDGWGNENSMIMQGLGILGRNRDNENARRVLGNLITQIPYDKKYVGIAAFYEMENGEAEVLDRIKILMSGLKENLDKEEDEMALVFYTKYETRIGGKEHYQDVMNRYRLADARAEKNNAYFMTAVIEGLDSIDQAVYEYYDGLKRLFKSSLVKVLEEEEMDINDKALAAYAILKACRLKVILAEKYEKIGMTWCEEVMAELNSKELNRGAAVMLVAEKFLH